MTNRNDMIRCLRCLSIGRPREADRRFVRDFLRKGVSWGTLLGLAHCNGVSGLLYAHLRTPDLMPFVPGTVARNLEQAFLETAAQVQATLSELESLAQRIESAKVPVMAIQGLSLMDVYPEPGLRPLGDADLMVAPENKGRFRKMLWEAGYTLPDFRYVDLYARNGVWLDIHSHILNMDRVASREFLFPKDLTALWERAVPLSEKMPPFLRPDPVDNFIVLAAHALKHSYSRLIWLVDLHELLLSGLDWQQLTERARFWRQERVVLYAVILLEGIFHLHVPPAIKNDLGATRFNNLEKYVLRLTINGFSSGQACFALWISNIKGVANKVRFVRESVFPEDRIMAQVLPQRSGRASRMDYVRRTGSILEMMARNAHQAVRFTYNKSAKK